MRSIKDNDYWFGYLSFKNAEEIAEKIRKLLYDNLFSIAEGVNFSSNDPPIKLQTNVHLRKSDWTDGNKDQVRLFNYENSVSISFSTADGICMIDSHWKGESLDQLIRQGAAGSDAFLTFSESGFSYSGNAGSGNFCKYVFVVQGPLPKEIPDRKTGPR